MRYFRNPFTLLIHIALVIIVAGALVTHFFGIQGKVTLTEGAEPVSSFDKSCGPGDGSFPFCLSLDSTEILCYPGTSAPMDFRSHIEVDGKPYTVSMNRIATFDGWRFYQSGMGEKSSSLSVSHDPWGIGITYSGYTLLLVGMAGFFMQRRSLWRSYLRKRLAMGAILLWIFPPAGIQARELPTMQRPLAADFGKIYVYWNDRVCPMQTMAMDVCAELYGSTTYRGLTAEQVLAGWLFYFDEWHEDYLSYRLSEKGKKEERRRALIGWLGSGEAFRIYPYHTADGRLEWLSLTGRRPSRMDLEQWKYMLHAMPEVSNCLSRGKNIAADSALTALAEGQRRYAGSDLLPSDFQFGAERFYNGYVRLFPAGGIMFVCGLLIMVTYVRRWVRISLNLTALLFLILVLLLRGIVGGHIPLGNGCETMIFMGFVAAGGAAVVRDRLLSGAFLTVAAVATLVAAMSSKTPQIASLMPVLSSPLLAIHVMLVMCAYAGCMLMAILGLLGLLTGDRKRRSEMALLDRILLAPTLFLLTAGIFVGAVWANQSWGRYWGWDPKETCALVTMLVYALPAHSASVRWFRDDTHLLGYLVAAILSVAFTYFGANYLLPGLHSYA